MTPEQLSGLSAVVEVVNVLYNTAPKTLDRILDRLDLETSAFFEALKHVMTLLGDDA